MVLAITLSMAMAMAMVMAMAMARDYLKATAESIRISQETEQDELFK